MGTPALTLVPSTPITSPRLLVEDLHKRYGDVVALSGVDLEIAPGEITALLGPNGAGKTTLVSIVAGLRRPDAGSVSLDGVDAFAEPRYTRKFLGLAPQDTGVYPTLPVYDNLRFFGELGGLRRRELSRRIAEVAEALGLAELLPRCARTLSGGEARRLHTGMTLMYRAPLLLLDEPTMGVDVPTRAALLDVVRGLASDGASVCYSTHYLPEVEQLGADVAIIDRGEIVAHGSLPALIGAHGQASVELRFQGTPPALVSRDDIQTSATAIRIATAESPAVAAAALLGELSPTDAQRLRAIELTQPSLESVFLEVTGRRYVTDESEPGVNGTQT